MQPWVQGLVILCLIAITIALVPAIIALRRSAERADRVLAIFEGELRPLVGEVRGLVHELRGLSEEARGEMQRIGGLTDRAQDAVEGLSRVMAAVTGLTRAGQLVGVAAGLKTGLEVFLHRLRRKDADGSWQGSDARRNQELADLGPWLRSSCPIPTGWPRSATRPSAVGSRS